MKRKIICLCGSTRFSEAFREANFKETLKGNIVLTIGCDIKSDNELFKDYGSLAITQIKADLDRLHFDKILLADEVLILNVGGYIGESTHHELLFAMKYKKRIRFLEENDLCDLYGINTQILKK